jgi:hypothetical protein
MLPTAALRRGDGAGHRSLVSIKEESAARTNLPGSRIFQIMEHVVTKASIAEAFADRLREHYGERLVKVLRVPHDPHEGNASPDIIYLIVIYDPELSEDERYTFFGVVTGFLLKEGGPYYVDAHPLSRTDYQYSNDAVAHAARKEGVSL